MNDQPTTAAKQAGSALAVRADGRGAEVANKRAMRHGLRSSRLPKGCERIGRDLLEFRRALESAVFELHGEVDATAALLISSATTWERHRRLAERWLRVSFDELSHSDRLNYSREAAKAATERNKVLEALRVDEQQRGNAFESILAASVVTHNASDIALDETSADTPVAHHSPASAATVPFADRPAAVPAGAGEASEPSTATDGNEPRK